MLGVRGCFAWEVMAQGEVCHARWEWRIRKKVAHSWNGEESLEVQEALVFMYLSCPLHQLVAFSCWFLSQYLVLGLACIRSPEPSGIQHRRYTYHTHIPFCPSTNWYLVLCSFSSSLVYCSPWHQSLLTLVHSPFLWSVLIFILKWVLSRGSPVLTTDS